MSSHLALHLEGSGEQAHTWSCAGGHRCTSRGVQRCAGVHNWRGTGCAHVWWHTGMCIGCTSGFLGPSGTSVNTWEPLHLFQPQPGKSLLRPQSSYLGICRAMHYSCLLLFMGKKRKQININLIVTQSFSISPAGLSAVQGLLVGKSGNKLPAE